MPATCQPVSTNREGTSVVAIYSDDHGKTWRLSYNGVGPLVGETQIAELADGTLAMNMRGTHPKHLSPTGNWKALWKGCRFGATSADGGKTGSKVFEIPALPDSCCQSSILRYTWAQPAGKSRILFCNPGNRELHQRTRGTIRLSYDEGKT